MCVDIDVGIDDDIDVHIVVNVDIDVDVFAYDDYHAIHNVSVIIQIVREQGKKQ